MTQLQRKPNFITRARLAWNFFKQGYPLQRKQAGKSILTWPAWRENTPQWHITSFAAYIEEGFNLNSIIYSAIMYKARSKLSAPLRAYTGDPGRPNLLPPDHPLSQLVSRPNKHQGWREFQMLTEIYFNLGNCFIFLKRPVGGGLPEAMYVLRPDRVFIIPGDGGIKGYLYVAEGQSLTDGMPVLPQDMMHIKLPNPLDPLEGMGYGLPPVAIAQSTDVDNDITRFLKLFFQNGAMLMGLLKFNMELDDETVAEVKRRWMDMYGGVDNWTEVGVLDQGGDYQRIGATFEEMGFKEVDERTESRILGPFGVPPILVGTRVGLNRSTFSNHKEARQMYWEDTALPELWLFEPEYQYHLSTDDGGFVAFDTSRVPALQKDVPKLITAAYTMWKMGTPANVAYETVGLRVSEIPGGDISYLPANVIAAGLDTGSGDTMEGAPDAEDDTRKGLIPDWVDSLPDQWTKHQPKRIEATCPLCDKPGVDMYEDHAGLCVCPHCNCTFDPQVYVEKSKWNGNGN